MGVLKEAQFYNFSQEGRIICILCPHNCSIAKGKTGVCRVRRHTGNQLTAESYGLVSSLNFDPVEKKPLYHFFPGQQVFSLGTVGCNLNCSFCQNCDISQAGIQDISNLKRFSPEQVVDISLSRPENIGIAFTYNEPSIWFEFVYDTAKQAKARGLKTIMVSNGFVEKEPMDELLRFIDAFNIDLKGFSEDFYRKVTGSKLAPVKDRLRQIRKAGNHLEVTNLVIPTLNDDPDKFKKMIEWIEGELGPDTVLHLSRYFPMNRMTLDSTPVQKLIELYEIADEKLNFVYLGNTHGLNEGRNTFCPDCGNLIVERFSYNIEAIGLTKNGNCASCGKNIAVNG